MVDGDFITMSPCRWAFFSVFLILQSSLAQSARNVDAAAGWDFRPDTF